MDDIRRIEEETKENLDKVRKTLSLLPDHNLNVYIIVYDIILYTCMEMFKSDRGGPYLPYLYIIVS